MVGREGGADDIQYDVTSMAWKGSLELRMLFRRGTTQRTLFICMMTGVRGRYMISDTSGVACCIGLDL